ncbi:hypothetical protein SPBR_03557 [Sporothrix brasiliensis 5110]|uniref:Uncharacterized protein n=1 Tax=Sporothrix brasiliensis 5110 TaxID=1398154 RepID=A0A0C2JDB9_9PEZI|nr:uncharacterized protein SPBR_03557 [Sporothrix brasiliensis 5110]KIH94947.1 hypothetical protein SPBR_03557 [Sporothrix brasiliensis 5110]
METPSRGSASSPDPLNERGDDAATLPILSSASRPITRSQRSNSMYSLDPHNRMHPSRFSSPRKQTFHLDVGSNVSPQKIRVTVETEDNAADGIDGQDSLADDIPDIADFDEGKVSRRLFPASTPVPSLPLKTSSAAAPASSSRRRQRGSSPSKGSPTKTSATRRKPRLSTTMTTKVPLRGLSDDEGEDASETTGIAATPKPKRGRPRRSGTPKPLTTIVEPSSPITATSASAAKVASSPLKRGRKPRAATPKAEETTGDELASVEATPALSSPAKRTPRATRKTATPKATPKATPMSAPKSTPKRTPKRTASSAFPGSEGESASESRPTKRGRGRPRKAMVPDEMAAIAENVLEEQLQEERLATQPPNGPRTEEPQKQAELGVFADGTASASPDPIMDDSDAITAHPFHAPTPNTIRRMRVAVSPAPTTLSSVDLISVQTPARPTFDTEPASIVDDEGKHGGDDLERTSADADDTADATAAADEDSGEDFAYGAPSADDYFSENGFGNYDIPETFDHSDNAVETASINATSPAPVARGVHDEELQTTHTAHSATVTLVETADVTDQPGEDIIDQAAASNQGDSEDELAPPIVSHSDAIESTIDAPVYSEDLHTATPQVAQARVLITPDTLSSPMMEAPTLTIPNIMYTGALPEEEQAAEASIAPAAAERVQDDALVTGNRKNDSQHSRSDQAHPDDRMLFSSAESPFVHEASILRDAQLAQSDVTAPDSDGEDVDAVLLGSTHGNEADSDAESELTGAAPNVRDMDTIAQGEDFSMIGVESLQTSFRTSNDEMPAMGEMTSRIVNRSLQSVRQGNQPTEAHDNDGLSYLDFIYQSDSPAPASVLASATKSSQITQSATLSTRTRENATVQQSSPEAKSNSPRKKDEPLREVIARKSLLDAHGSSATPRVVASVDKAPNPASPEPQQQFNNQEYDDSFSEIPDSVLEAAVPQTTTTTTPFFSRHQAELTGQFAMGSARANANVEAVEPHHEGQSSPVDAAAEDDDQAAHSQPDVEAEITSSPPIHFARAQHAAISEQAAQRPRLLHEIRTTPVAFQSPRYPVTADQNDYLRVPSEGFRPSLSPIVRAGRALQSVTSDPPTPKENEGFLRSPFRSSVARDTQSPAAAQGHDSSSPQPASDEGPIQDQLLREQGSEEDDEVAGHAEQATLHTDATDVISPTDAEDDNVEDDNTGDAINEEDDQDEESEYEEVADEEPNEDPQVITPSQQSHPAATTTQQSPASMPRAAWNMAKAPFSGFKNLVLNGAQVISPRLSISAPDSGSPASLPPSTPGGAQGASPTPAARPAPASPQKRTASEAELDAQPSSSAQPGPRSVKRLRMQTPARANNVQPGSGSDTNRSWRSYIFRENSVAGSITGFATKLISRTPRNDNHHRETETSADTEADAQVEANSEDIEISPGNEAAVDAEDNMNVNIVSLAEADVGAEDNMVVNTAALPDINTTSESRPKATLLTSEANSTQYGSDAIMSMINDISGEGQDVHAITEIEPDRQSAQSERDVQDEDDVGMDTFSMTTVNKPIPGEQDQIPVEAYPSEHFDDDVDIWAIEAERTTRFATTKLQQHQPIVVPRSTERSAPNAESSPMRDPRVTRIQGQEARRAARKQWPAPTPLGYDPDREKSLVEEDSVENEEADELQGPSSSVKNSPRPAGRFNLDDFFSSPVALPRQLPPTSKKNIQYNEESRRQAMEQFLEHERRREEREALPQSATVQKQKQSHLVAPRTANRSFVSSSEPDLNEQSDSIGELAATNPPSEPISEAATSTPEADALGALPPTNPMTSNKKASPTTPASADSRQLQLGSGRSRSSRGSPPAEGDRIIEDEDALERLPANPSEIRRRFLENFKASTTFTAKTSSVASASSPPVASATTADQLAADRQSLETASGSKENQPPASESRHSRPLVDSPVASPVGSPEISPPGLPAPVNQELVALMSSEVPRKRFMFSRPSLAHPSLARPPRTERNSSLQFITPKKPAPQPVKPTAAQNEPVRWGRSASQQQESSTQEVAKDTQAGAQPASFNDGPRTSFTPQTDAQSDDVEQSPQSLGGDDSYLSQEQSGVNEEEQEEESSFVTPLLKPLPAKSASPTKSCLRPTTKPKTPGRVVEFTSSTMAGASKEIAAVRESLDATDLEFAEHFQLDTGNRLPSPVLTERPATEANIERVGEDGDVRMWDRKEVSQQESQGRGYVVDRTVSDIMLADTHQISVTRPYHPVPQTSAAAAVAGEGFFFPSNAIVYAPWEAPAKNVSSPGRAWQLGDWVELNNVLQTYRREGKADFVSNHLLAHLRNVRKHPEWPVPERATKASADLLHKVVHTDRIAMLIKSWHLDVVDVFALRAGRIWNEHYLVRRLFSLLISEESRGAFKPWRRRP